MNHHRYLWLVLLALVPGFTWCAQADVLLVNHGDAWRYRKGTNAPQSDWKTAADTSLDATWLSGNGGIGYADNTPETINCQTLLPDMKNLYSTLYMRRQFTVSSAVDTNLHLSLSMDFDDGFIAWLDGVYLTSANVSGAPTDPAFNALAPASHESSKGNSPPQNAPAITDLGAVGTRLGIGAHTLAIIGLNNTLASSDLIMIPDLSLVTNSSGGSCISGAITANTTWYASNSPVAVCGNVTVNNGITLTVEAGTTVQFAAGVNVVIANGGVLIAEGNSNAPIHFTRSGASGNWGNIMINGAVGSPETRIKYATFDFNAANTGTPCIDVQAGTVLLDHLTFRNTGAPYIHVDGASFVISDCYFPPATADFEPCHGQHGIKSGGHGLFLRNFFGKPRNYNDVVDFTGGNRPNYAIVQFIDNVLTGGDDDGFDLDGTDAWVEGNIFLHMHKNGSTPDSSSAVSGGNNTFAAGENGGVGTETSEITIIRNIIFDCDEAADAKQGNFFTFLNNTIVHQSHVGGIDTDGAVVILADAGTTEGRGMYVEGNVIFDAEKLTRNVTAAVVTFTNNILPMAWTGPGGGNSVTDPLLKHVPTVAEATFTNWADAQIMWTWFSLQTNSPAIGTGPEGRDKGALIPPGAYLSGEPASTTTQTVATITVGINRTGSSIPTTGFPLGSGYTHYKWRLDTNTTWSSETSIATPIHLSGLGYGTHYVDVIGKNDAGFYEDDALLGVDAAVTRSAIWTVVSPLRVNRISLTGPRSLELEFDAQANTGYSLLYRDSLSIGSWQTRLHLDPTPSAQTIVIPDSIPDGVDTRFYQLSSP